MKKDLQSILRKYLPNFNIRLIFINNFKIGSFFKYKDSLPKAVRSGLVYEFSCAQCASRYQGSTLRNLHMRVAEHSGKSFRTQANLSKPPESAIRAHSQNCPCEITIDKFRILGYNSNLIDLRILESIYIFNTKPTLNNSDSAYPLNILG